MENQKPQPFNKSKRITLQELSERNDIVITKANKGGAVVIADVKY